MLVFYQGLVFHHLDNFLVHGACYLVWDHSSVCLQDSHMHVLLDDRYSALHTIRAEGWRVRDESSLNFKLSSVFDGCDLVMFN